MSYPTNGLDPYTRFQPIRVVESNGIEIIPNNSTSEEVIESVMADSITLVVGLKLTYSPQGVFISIDDNEECDDLMTCEVKGSRLSLMGYDEEADKITYMRISLEQFIQKVKERVQL